MLNLKTHVRVRVCVCHAAGQLMLIVNRFTISRVICSVARISYQLSRYYALYIITACILYTCTPV